MLAMPAAEKVGLMMHWPLGQFLGFFDDLMPPFGGKTSQLAMFAEG